KREYPLNLSRYKWKEFLKWFLISVRIKMIKEQTGLSEYKVLRCCDFIRMVMEKDIPEIFEGVVEVDETYIGGNWRNKSKRQRNKEEKSKRGRGTTKQPVLGILCRDGKVWAREIDGVEGKDLQPIIEGKVKKGTVVCSDTWRGYTGIAAKGYLHRLVNHGKGEYSNGKGNHINGLEGFWGYLKRQLSSRGGIRKEKRKFYLAEYVWKYNNRELTTEEKINKLLDLTKNLTV
ncbi:MAG: IS1595 family transposase, partial [Candidatus Omnitrophica bacterium]|nr:IS1595 family transposase [Candidatus Omnitrophota bacterium]